MSFGSKKNMSLLFVPALCYQFFQYRAIPLVILKLTGFISSAVLFLISFKEIFFKQYSTGSIPFWIKTIICLTLFSFLTALIVWDQPIQNSFRSSINFINLSFFFVLVKWRVDQNQIIRLIQVYAILVMLLWVYAISQFPTMMFGKLGDDDVVMKMFDNRGGIRIRLLGHSFAILCLYYYIGKAMTTTGKGKLMYFILSFVVFVFTCTDKTRSNMVSIVGAAIIMLYFYNKNAIVYVFKICVLGIAVLCLLMYFFGDTVIALVELTEDQFSSGSKEDDGLYRLKEYIFFFTEFKNSFFTILFGNGAGNHSELQMYLDSMKQKGYFLNDVNYANIYITLGIVGLIAYIGLVRSILIIPTAKNIFFAKIYIVYSVFATITIDALLDSIPLSICAYLIYNNHQQIKNNHTNENKYSIKC